MHAPYVVCGLNILTQYPPNPYRRALAGFFAEVKALETRYANYVYLLADNSFWVLALWLVFTFCLNYYLFSLSGLLNDDATEHAGIRTTVLLILCTRWYAGVKVIGA